MPFGRAWQKQSCHAVNSEIPDCAFKVGHGTVSGHGKFHGRVVLAFPVLQSWKKRHGTLVTLSTFS